MSTKRLELKAEDLTPRSLRRLLAHVNRSGECWIWTGTVNSEGYGRLTIRGRKKPAHRAMYALVYGAAPAGMVIDHLCRNHSCVNPAHLEAVTDTENKRRGLGGLLRTHCPQGHLYTEANTQWVQGGTARRCGECRRTKYHARRMQLSKERRAQGLCRCGRVPRPNRKLCERCS